MALYNYPSSSRQPSFNATTEFEVLKASHKFLRGEDEVPSTWDEQMAKKYYDSLYREFAVCDLKHYKSGNFHLRWRTEDEVLSGAGESTCGNTRCPHHDTNDPSPARLQTLELPFGYEEGGEFKSALVKVVLCHKCVKKLMWKRMKEKEKEKQDCGGLSQESGEGKKEAGGLEYTKAEAFNSMLTYLASNERDAGERIPPSGLGRKGQRHKDRRSSRSRSPRGESVAHSVHSQRRRKPTP